MRVIQAIIVKAVVFDVYMVQDYEFISLLGSINALTLSFVVLCCIINYITDLPQIKMAVYEINRILLQKFLESFRLDKVK